MGIGNPGRLTALTKAVSHRLRSKANPLLRELSNRLSASRDLTSRRRVAPRASRIAISR
jgi:hypothetical protein